MKPPALEHLLTEAVCRDFLGEAHIIRYVQQHRPSATIGDIMFALRSMKRRGLVESLTPAGERSKLWRRVVKAAA